ncbi:MAG: polymer-forming cytoskeletal protein [Gammaproteobacteria bacterium]|nr:MAG: polymer-forming cytoskeletal protein [Gammaproteobacteria bacterium]
MRKKNNPTNFAAGSTTLIASGTHVMGDVRFAGNLEVEGQITGNIMAEDGADARVRILPKGCVVGDVNVPVVVINGRIEGNIYSTHHVELAANAEVEGDLHYALIEIEKGAQVNGNFVHRSPSTAPEQLSPVENVAETGMQDLGS